VAPGHDYEVFFNQGTCRLRKRVSRLKQSPQGRKIQCLHLPVLNRATDTRIFFLSALPGNHMSGSEEVPLEARTHST